MKRIVPLIVITGCSGTGKTSLQNALVGRFDIESFSGGGILRSVALSLIRNHKPIENADAAFVKMLFDTDAVRQDINNPDIKGEVFGKYASVLGSQPIIKYLIGEYVASLFFMGSEKKAMLLDMHVPYIRTWSLAALHFNLVADDMVCARRKFADYISQGAKTTLAKTYEDISKRNFLDYRRSGVVANPYAIDIDTTHISQKSVVDIAAGIVRERLWI